MAPMAATRYTPRQPPAAMHPEQEVAAGHVQRADRDQQSVEERRGLVDRPEVADGRSVEVVARGDGRGEHRARQECHAEQEEQRPGNLRVRRGCNPTEPSPDAC